MTNTSARIVSGFQGLDSAPEVIDLLLDRGNGRRFLISYDRSHALPAHHDAFLAKHVERTARGRVGHTVLCSQGSDGRKSITHLVLAGGNGPAQLIRQLKVGRARIVEIERHQIRLKVLGHLGQLLVSVAGSCSSCSSTASTFTGGWVIDRSS